jgi:hypothetical protein
MVSQGSGHGQLLGRIMPITCSAWVSSPGGQAQGWSSLTNWSAWTKCACCHGYQRGHRGHLTPWRCCHHRATQQQLGLGSWGLCAVLMNPRLLGCSELCILRHGVVLVGLKPSDFVDLRLVWGSAFAWASAAASAPTSTSATTSSTGVPAPAATTPTAAELGNAA